MLEKISQIKKAFFKESLEVSSLRALYELETKYLGRKSELSQILRSLKNLPEKERKTIGRAANLLKEEITKILSQKKSELKAKEEKITSFKEEVDLTLPGKKFSFGSLHPLTLVLREIKAIFLRMGFEIVEGPEIETTFYNFEALNIPDHHPARDLWSTFWLESKKKFLLRTHTSPVQIRYLEKHQPPLRIIAPGRVFRKERTDANHEIQFYQVEGLVVDKNINLANFKAIIKHFFKEFFKKNLEIRLRQSYFPFTEPSIEVDIKFSSKKKTKEKWLEIMGAGMVHPQVFKSVNLNPLNWQGFAFGMGLDRLAMIKYRIPDIRLFYRTDLRFIKQF